jgi:hypothetical protein
MIKILLAASVAISCLTASAVAASDPVRIFVMRPQLPGVQAGVLPRYAFDVVAPTPQNPGTVDGGSASEYTFISKGWEESSATIKASTLKVRVGFETPETLQITLPSIMRNSICGIDQDKNSHEVKGLYYSNNQGGMLIQAQSPGTYASLVICTGPGGPDGTYFWHEERLLITVPN